MFKVKGRDLCVEGPPCKSFVTSSRTQELKGTGFEVPFAGISAPLHEAVNSLRKIHDLHFLTKECGLNREGVPKQWIFLRDTGVCC